LPAQFVTLTSALNQLLSTGTEYWFVITNTAAEEVAWYENNQGITGGVWAGNDLSSLLNFEGGSPVPAIQLNSLSSVPEPATAVLLGGALPILVLSSKRTRSNRARRNVDVGQALA
jgi:hypothetical protein